MAKVVINTINSLTNTLSAISLVNENFEALAEAIENTMSRDGTLPNNMEADLDMDGNDILNVNYLAAKDIVVSGEPISALLEAVVVDVENIGQYVEAAEGYATTAQTAASISSANALVAQQQAGLASNFSTQALDAAMDAQEAVDSIGDSVSDAQEAALSASNSANSANDSRIAAATSANNASISATNASDNAISSGINANAAEDSAEEAVLAAGYAEEWAIAPEDTPVSVAAGGDGSTTFSALHWAMKASAAAEFDPTLYYTKLETDNLISDFVTDDDVDSKLVNYYTKSEVDNLIDDIDLSVFYTKTESDARYATAAQGTLAGTALQPAAIGVSVQAYDVDTAKTDVTQTWSASQKFGRTSRTVATTSGASLDNTTGSSHTRTVNANITFTVAGVPASGEEFTMYLKITYTSGTITWFSGVQWVKGTAPAFTGGKVYEVILTTQNGGTTWHGAAGEYNA